MLGMGSLVKIAEMCRGSEAGWYLKLVDFVHHSTLDLRVMQKKKCSDADAGSPSSLSLTNSTASHGEALSCSELTGSKTALV